MVIRWRLGILAALLLCTVSPALAQRWMVSSDCPECRQLEQEADAEEDKAKENPLFSGFGRTGAVGRLDECMAACALKSKISPLPPEVSFVRHREAIAACPACADAARAAAGSLARMASVERDYLGMRAEAAEQRAWLDAHAGERGSAAYSRGLLSYYRYLFHMRRYEDELNEAQSYFENAMKQLADCNERLCKNEYKTPLLPKRDYEEPVAACPDCAKQAFDVKYCIAILEREDAKLADLVAQRSAILRINQQRSLTDAEEASITDLDQRVKWAEQDKSTAEENLESRRAALDACNKAHPAESCKPPVAAGQGTFPGGTTSQPPSRGTSVPGGTAPGPGAKASPGGASPTAPPDSRGSPPSWTPLPGGPADTTPANPPPIIDNKEIARLYLDGPNVIRPYTWGIVAGYEPIPAASQATVPKKASAATGWTGAPPQQLATGEAFTFEVKGDAEALDRVLANPFVFDPHSHPLPGGGYIVTSSAGANAKETWANLQGLSQAGKIVNLEVDPAWHFLPDGVATEPDHVVRIWDTFPETLRDSYRQTPVAGAHIMYGPLQPTPFFNPGERPGDEMAPTIVRSESDGSYRISASGFSGPIEIRAAKGPEERHGLAIVAAPPASIPAGAAVPGKQVSPGTDPYWTSSGSWGQSYRDKWGLERIGWTPDIARQARSPVIVAVIDTGLDYYHPALPRGNIFVNERETLNGRDDDGNGYIDDVVGWNFVDNNANPWDNAGHGTLVAGIIAEIDPQVRILPLKVLNFIGQGRASRVAEAIYYAVGMGARVINLSLGGDERSQAAERAIAYAGSKGVLVVMAAGNGGARIARAGPSSLPNVITVGATGVDDKRASFSNYGAIDLAAPGVDILSLRARRTDVQLVAGVESYVAGKNFVGEKARYYRANGTSFAAPFVTGVAALILSRSPDLDTITIKRMIIQSARDPGTVGVNPETGYGILDAKTALAADPHYYIDADIAEVSAQRTGAGTVVRVSGTADADRFASAWIEIGAGESPTEWRRVSRTLDNSVRGGQLDDLAAQNFAGAAVWTLRLVVKHVNGTNRETRHVLRLG